MHVEGRRTVCPVSGWEIVIGTVALALGGALHGSMGFGIGLVAGPLLVLIDPELIPGPMLCSAVLLTAMITVRDRATADERGVRWLIAGRVPGMVLGALVVTWLSATGLAIVFAFAILAIVAVSAAGVSLPQTTPALLGAGTMSGLMGTTLGVGGPALALAYQRSHGDEIRGTLAPIQTFGAATWPGDCSWPQEWSSASRRQDGRHPVYGTRSCAPRFLRSLACRRLRSWCAP